MSDKQVPEGAQPSTTITMKMLCPRCKKTLKEFEPTDSELEMFDDEELKAGEALHHRPCETCQAKANRRNW